MTAHVRIGNFRLNTHDISVQRSADLGCGLRRSAHRCCILEGALSCCRKSYWRNRRDVSLVRRHDLNRDRTAVGLRTCRRNWPQVSPTCCWHPLHVVRGVFHAPRSRGVQAVRLLWCGLSASLDYGGNRSRRSCGTPRPARGVAATPLPTGTRCCRHCRCYKLARALDGAVVGQLCIPRRSCCLDIREHEDPFPR